MSKIIGIVFITIITSFYFFPFEFVFLPGINTKMALAGIGLVILGIRLAKGQRSMINKDIATITLYALGISLASFITVIYNNTNDYSFASYFISMWVWLGGAYTVTICIKLIHGQLSVRLLANYLIAVCVAQCIIAFSMTLYEPLKLWVDSFLGGEEAFMGKAEGRIYGIGAALDVAGLRFSAVLVMIAYLCTKIRGTSHDRYMWIYLLAFLIITVLGNMIARTTTMGVVLAISYWIISSGILWLKWDMRQNALFKHFLIIVLIAVPILVGLYQTNPTIKENIRFGFEGFFSLVEKGRWEVSSNEILTSHMIIFPEDAETWIIGDGYAANPEHRDPYYTGPSFHGFYMGTDIGYCRFLFYFGLIGTLAFITYFIKVTSVCCRRFSGFIFMFILILCTNLIGWCKVSTDIFLAFAPFLCISSEENDEYEKRITFLTE